MSISKHPSKDAESTLLLILVSRPELYPLSPSALHQAQSTWRERRAFRNALVLSRDGTLRRVERIEVLGPLGQTFMRKLVSVLTSAWRIRTHLSPALPYALPELKALLIDRLSVTDPENITSAVDHGVTSRQLIDRVHASDSVLAIFDALCLPTTDEALDVL